MNGMSGRSPARRGWNPWLIRGLIIGGVILGAITCQTILFIPKKAYLWLLPPGYVGWVRIDFGVPGEAPLTKEDGYSVLPVPADGVVRTCDSLITSPSRELFRYQAGGTRRSAGGPIAGWTSQRKESALRGGHDVSLYNFFGSREQWERARPPVGEPPSPGWIRGSSTQR